MEKKILHDDGMVEVIAVYEHSKRRIKCDKPERL